MEFEKALAPLNPPEDKIVTEVYWNNLLTELRTALNNCQDYLEFISGAFNTEFDTIISDLTLQVNNNLNISSDNVFVGSVDLTTTLQNIPAPPANHNALSGTKFVSAIGNGTDANHFTNDIWDTSLGMSLAGRLTSMTNSINGQGYTLTTKQDKTNTNAIGYGTSGVTPFSTARPGGTSSDWKAGDIWIVHA
jgi:hypothetical protein